MPMRFPFVLGFAALVLVAAAQGGPGNVTLQAQDMDVRVALRLLFTQADLSYSVDPAVQGTVTVSVKDVPFETALRLVLHQVKAEFAVEGGVYVVRTRSEPPPLPTVEDRPLEPLSKREDAVATFTVWHADPYVIIMLLRGEQPLSPEWWTLHNLMGSGMPGVGGYGPAMGGYGPGFGGWSQFGAPSGMGPSQWGGATGLGPGGPTGFSGPNFGAPGGWSGSRGGPGGTGSSGGGRGMGASGSQAGLIEQGTLLVDPATNRIIYIPPSR